MGHHVIKMPDIGEGIAEAELVEWLVAPGDLIAEDQPLAAVMTPPFPARCRGWLRPPAPVCCWPCSYLARC